MFATGARDKKVKLWTVTEDADIADGGVSASATEELPAFASAVTAVSFASQRWKDGRLILAVGLEDGGVHLWAGGGSGGALWAPLVSVAAADCHAAAVKALMWRGRGGGGGGDGEEEVMALASSGADHAVRLFEVF